SLDPGNPLRDPRPHPALRGVPPRLGRGGRPRGDPLGGRAGQPRRNAGRKGGGVPAGAPGGSPCRRAGNARKCIGVIGWGDPRGGTPIAATARTGRGIYLSDSRELTV